MPATEATWRDTKLLHRIFAVTGVLLVISTVWMLWKDNARSWKSYQVDINQIDLRMNELRQKQYETGDALLAHEQAAAGVAAAKSQPFDAALLAQFKQQAGKLNEVLAQWEREGYPYNQVAVNTARIDSLAQRQAELGEKARQARATATRSTQAADAAATSPADDPQRTQRETQAVGDERAAQEAERQAGETYDELVSQLRSIVDQGKVREDKALGFRKFRSADIDAARAQLDIAIRDNLGEEEIARRQKVVEQLVSGKNENDKNSLNRLNDVYQSISAARKDLDRALKQLTAPVEAAKKSYEDSIAELERLKKQHADREEHYFDLYPQWPFFLGKKILTLPILDAFSSPRKIDNLWSDGLTQDYNFSRVRRFDRCTTCHQSLAKTLPGQPTTPAYVKAEEFELEIVPPAADAPPKPRLDAEGKPLPLTLADWLGLELAEEGLLSPLDVTVGLVLPKTPAAKAVIRSKLPPNTTATGLELRQQAAQLTSPPGEGENLYPELPGLLVGDVIVRINGQPLATSGGDRGPKHVEAMLTLLAAEGKPIRLTVRRGLPNPYISHPRLDLFVSDSSPHRMQVFACTVCHEGQGSATDFKWASHTPNTTLDMRRWISEHGWFDNPHWIYPMFARRFAESACLKCHHDVTELAQSDRFTDAPAPKVTHGYQLIVKYGCYGCHEVNGFDGPSRRIGPDLRSEPNYFAVAQQLLAELAAAAAKQPVTAQPAGAAESSPGEGPAPLAEWKAEVEPLAERLAAHPEDNATRGRLRTLLEERVAAVGEQAGALERTLAGLANMLKDVEVPGTLRRAGPSLRYVNSKVDAAFLYDWIANPQRFRPDTRMPRFFGLWDHLRDEHGKLTDTKGPRLEPIEIRGLVAYLQSYAGMQKFEPEQRPTGIDPWTDEQKIARGKIQFQTRGCLACHNHKDFSEVDKYRAPDEIVQGPDLSAVGDKFSPERNKQGPDWLYSWIKNPSRYHTRTLMPNLFLDRERDPGANLNDPSDDKWFDPADDIVTYLLAASKSSWRPVLDNQAAAAPLSPDEQQALKELTLEYLNEAFYKDQAATYYTAGIPPEMEGELKGAEKDLIVAAGGQMTDAQRLKYIGRKTINKYGCFGCHDIPGFEDAKPIGTGLADWGRKDPARLAFEHITHYVGHGHGGTGHAPAAMDALYQPSPAKSKAADPAAVAQGDSHAAAGDKGGQADPDAAAHAAPVPHDPTATDEMRDFYAHALEAGNRIGFIHQKLLEPRSFDFEKTENKKFNERLRMPQFPFSAREREAVITFVLGLVADPPAPKFIFQPKGITATILAGKRVLEKYNCSGCHILGLERWRIRHQPGEIGQRSEPPMYSYLRTHFSPRELAEAAVPDRRNELHATLEGLPPADKADGYPLVFDIDNLVLENDSPYKHSELKYALDLYRPSIVDGSPYVTGQAPVAVPAASIDARYPTWGGVLTRYLLPVVTALERQANPNASGAEAYGWLPPPLIGQGKKVQTSWLHDFLLEPYPIRPAVFLRMPRFNMSSAEAATLANYFAAVDNAEYPYAYASSRDQSRLVALEAEYKQRAQGGGSGPGSGAKAGEAPPGMQRLDDAMKIVLNGNFCVKCHLVADFEPAGSPRAKAPNLADVYRRLRPEYVRDWIANPKMILPYTSMPVNIPYQDPPPILSQLYHGTNVEQIDALTDLLMNYDEYARRSTRIADRVQPVPTEGTPAQPAATGTTGGGSPE